MVAVEEQGVSGYVVAHYAADMGEILNLGVTPARRRRGLGGALVQEVLAALGTQGVTEVFLEVRESNASARRLYEGRGFHAVGRRAKYYRRPSEDAVILRAAIPAAEPSA